MLLLTNQITDGKFLSGINYLVRLRPKKADDVELINGIRKNFSDIDDQNLKNSQQETLERFVNGQDVLLFQPTRLGKVLSLGCRMSDNNIESGQCKH